MTIEEAIRAIECNRPTSGYIILREALDMAIAALRAQQERENPKPLTLEELEKVKMDAPILVYVVLFNDETHMPEYGEWMIFDGHSFYSDEAYDGLDNYGTMFVAYRHKPKEETQEWID